MTDFKVGDKIVPEYGDWICLTACIEDATYAVITDLDFEGHGWRYSLHSETGEIVGHCEWCQKPSNSKLMEAGLKTLNGLAKGDVVIDEDDDERTVLARIEDAVLMSDWRDQDEAGSWYTIHELTQDGWKLKQTEPAPEVQELTVAEIEEKLGVQSGTLRIKKDA